MQPAAAHNSAAATAVNKHKEKRILLAETLDENIEEVIFVHLKNVEHQSGGNAEKGHRGHDEKVFGFQHFLSLRNSVGRDPVNLVTGFDIFASGRDISS